MNKMKLLLADDHPIYIEGLVNLLKSYDYEIAACVSNGREAVEQALKLKPDAILMDANMPELNGIDATIEIKKADPTLKVIILTGLDDEQTLFNAVNAGASGFLLKNLDGDELNRSLQDLKSEKNPFSPGLQQTILNKFREDEVKTEKNNSCSINKRHLDILKHVAEGLTYKEIGDILFISERTVKYHVKKIKENYNITSHSQLIELYKRFI
ncbi:MAG: response regulator transcription factor [Spirochaetales bacterium]|nr:response regulator transcription factor [Spirochaetales bacterium]